MPSVIPSGYVYWDGFGYVRESDKTGPYAISSSGTATLIGSGGGGGGDAGTAVSLWSLFILNQLKAS